MSLTDTDRRRFIAVTVLTLVALPALWWANTSEGSSAPNLAVAGIDPGVDTGATADGATAAPTATDRNDIAPVYLEGPASAAGAGQSAIAVPAKPLHEGVSAKATFRSSVSNGTCIVTGFSSGTRITVVNLANNRSVTCTAVLAPGNPADDVLMPTSAFAEIADLTDAPISVEIRR